MLSPTLAAPWSTAGLARAVLSTLTAGEGASPATVAVEGALTGLLTPLAVPVAVAVSTTNPLSTSAWVMV